MNPLQPLHLVDAVLAITILEGLALAAWHRHTGSGVAPRDYVLNLVSGLCLMVTLRMVLAGADWPWIAIGMSAAGVAHATDMWCRWHSAGRPRG